MAGDVRGARAVAERGARGRAGEPALVLIVEQREHRVAAIDGVTVDLVEDGFDAILGHALVGVGDGFAAFRERFFAQLEDVVFEGHLVVLIRDRCKSVVGGFESIVSDPPVCNALFHSFIFLFPVFRLVRISRKTKSSLLVGF